MDPLGPIALSVFMFFGQGADAVSTQQALTRCPACSEGNAAMANPAVRLGAKGAVVTLASVGCFKLWPHHKAEAIALAIVIGGSGFALAAHNRNVGR